MVRRLRSAGFHLGAPAFIRVFKRESVLELWLERDGRFARFARHRICRWSGVLGPKLAEGDGQSPEGFYSITRQQLRSHHRNHRAIDIGYPNAFDRANRRTGSHIQLHGGCGSQGCFALTDAIIEEVYDIVSAALASGESRVPVHVYPFELTERALAGTHNHPWHGFWRQLKSAYDIFERERRVAEVEVCGADYSVDDGDRASRSPHCTEIWQPGPATRTARSSTSRPAIRLRCNLGRASCRRWLHLKRRQLARGNRGQGRRRRSARR